MRAPLLTLALARMGCLQTYRNCHNNSPCRQRLSGFAKRLCFFPWVRGGRSAATEGEGNYPLLCRLQKRIAVGGLCKATSRAEKTGVADIIGRGSRRRWGNRRCPVLGVFGWFFAKLLSLSVSYILFLCFKGAQNRYL